MAGRQGMLTRLASRPPADLLNLSSLLPTGLLSLSFFAPFSQVPVVSFLVTAPPQPAAGRLLPHSAAALGAAGLAHVAPGREAGSAVVADQVVWTAGPSMARWPVRVRPHRAQAAERAEATSAPAAA